MAFGPALMLCANQPAHLHSPILVHADTRVGGACMAHTGKVRSGVCHPAVALAAIRPVRPVLHQVLTKVDADDGAQLLLALCRCRQQQRPGCEACMRAAEDGTVERCCNQHVCAQGHAHGTGPRGRGQPATHRAATAPRRVARPSCCCLGCSAGARAGQVLRQEPRLTIKRSRWRQKCCDARRHGAQIVHRAPSAANLPRTPCRFWKVANL